MSQEVAPRRGGRARTATDKNKPPEGSSKRDHAHWKKMERHWAGWTDGERDDKMKETFDEREEARQEFEAEQVKMEDE